MRKGFKQTEVGVIPEDWDDVRLGDLTTKVGSGITPTGGERVYKQEGRPFLRSQNVGWGKLLLDDIAFIDEQTHSTFQDTQIEDKDVFLNITGASIGRSTIADHRVVGGNVNQHVCIIRAVREKLNPKFLNYFLLSKTGQKQIDSFQSGGNRQGLNFGQIRSFRIFLPPTHAEQEAIAEALSDADALIESLETLLAKKRQVKQGAMSELLTGKRRVVESGEWKVKKLGDIFEIGAGGDFDPARSSDVQDERFPYPIYSNAITDNGLYGFCSYNDHQSGSITVTARGTLGVANYRDHDFTAIGRVIVLKPIQPLDGHFISEYINNRIEFVVESTGVPQLTAPQISKYEILFPPFEEQTAIAEILSDMDAEIRAVEEKLSKARGVKAGMMSELLTGRIRLVES